MRSVAVLACVAALAFSAPVDSGAAQAAALTLRLYNSARIPRAQLATARDTALGILDAAGIGVRFRECGRCDEPLGPTEVVVRLIPAPAFNVALHADAFGVTYVVRDSDRGWLATVFVDRIDAAAGRVRVDAGRLLGRVMAHEVGHLLLGVGYHGRVGLMQAEWTDAMLAQRDRDWRFSAREAALIMRRHAHR